MAEPQGAEPVSGHRERAAGPRLDLAALREDYQRRGLDRRDLVEDPVEQFERWFDEWLVTQPYDANAMVVATVDAEGRPAARYVLLKGVDARGFVFFTNQRSAKGVELAVNPQAALCFGWPALNRQVRMEGQVEVVEAELADAYFAGRPRGSQLGAWASNQSEAVADRSVLDGQLAEAEARYAGLDVPRPPHWGGYRVVPDRYEFWQGRGNRLHDRFQFLRSRGGSGAGGGSAWVIERLAP